MADCASRIILDPAPAWTLSGPVQVRGCLLSGVMLDVPTNQVGTSTPVKRDKWQRNAFGVRKHVGCRQCGEERYDAGGRAWFRRRDYSPPPSLRLTGDQQKRNVHVAQVLLTHTRPSRPC